MKVSRLGLRASAWGGIVVAGLALALTGQGAAQADTAAPAGTTSGNGSVGSGNQLVLPISVPIDLCGNVVAALGLGRAQCTGGAAVASGAGGGGAGGAAESPGLGKVEQAAPTTQNTGASGTSGTGGLLSGNEISVPVTVPVTVCGNAAAVLGSATASCQSPPRPSSQPQKSPVPPRPRHVMQSAPAHPKAIHPETASVTGILPITGVNLAGMTAGAAIFLTVGAGTLLGARRRG